jgi:hypothetical protein
MTEEKSEAQRVGDGESRKEHQASESRAKTITPPSGTVPFVRRQSSQESMKLHGSLFLEQKGGFPYDSIGRS